MGCILVFVFHPERKKEVGPQARSSDIKKVDTT